MRIEVVGVDCPVLAGVTVGMQRRAEVVDEHPADGSELRWSFEVRLVSNSDLRGPYVHGRPGDRFLYLSWARPPDGMFRRAKLMLNEVPANLLVDGDKSGLQGRVGLSMADGSPLCAAVRPPAVTWSAL